MKLKSIPLDFRVSENVSLQIGGEGTFYAFALKKEGLATPEALRLISRKARVRRSAWRHAGLKDKHALTRQHVTIPAGEWRAREPRRGDVVDAGRARLEFLGRCADAIRRGHIVSNTFEITMRNLTRAKVESTQREWGMLLESGMPNYFDSQRFGSGRHGMGLAMAELLRGEGERALRLLLTASSRKDHRLIKERRKRAARLWGRWDELVRALPTGPERAAAERLAKDGADFEAAFEAYERASDIPYDVLAFQSLLYNLMVSAAIVESGEPFFNVEIADEELAYATRKPSVLSAEEPLSLAHPGKQFDEPWQKYFEAACGKIGVEPQSIDESELSRKMWDRSARRTWAVIRETAAPRVLKDELYPDRRALVVSFELPPASYATLAIKRLQHAAR